ncbi:MAG: xylanase [Clostridia bacterium]|nr:xylanase [Clostridia bacterium]
MKNRLLSLLASAVLLCSCCLPALAEVTMKIDENVTYQTIESFGTSGAWWSQYVGLWDSKYQKTMRTNRQRIATLLFDPTYGIGLTNYRYNLGAGSADSGNGNYTDPNRRAQSFETAPGVYDWSKDAGAMWFVQEVIRLGCEEVVLFFNSPLERLTKNGWAHLTPGGEKSNIDPENYGEWAVYACDVAEHFLELGVPVKFISPINEPQWDWTGSQEGCHYAPSETTGVYLAFLEEMQKRPALAGVELSGPESGEWGGQTPQYVSALMGNETLRAHMSAVDCHSYWSNTQSKISFRNFMDVFYPEKAVRMSEWCEMVNGSDFGMDSAIVLAKCVQEDLTILDVVSWATWVGVAPGGYHDGLIYASQAGDGSISIVPLKRLWAYGNYTRFIRPGFTRVDVSGNDDLRPVAFKGEKDGKEQLILVLINDQFTSQKAALEGDFSAYSSMEIHETSNYRDLARTYQGAVKTEFSVPMQSVVTVVLTK